MWPLVVTKPEPTGDSSSMMPGHRPFGIDYALPHCLSLMVPLSHSISLCLLGPRSWLGVRTRAVQLSPPPSSSPSRPLLYLPFAQSLFLSVVLVCQGGYEEPHKNPPFALCFREEMGASAPFLFFVFFLLLVNYLVNFSPQPPNY